MMEKDAKQELKVSGYMKLPGGTYNDLMINGGLELTSGIVCRDVHVNGLLGVNGSLKARQVKVDGRMSVSGEFEADELNARGRVELGGRSKIRIFKADGSAEVKGSIDASEIYLRGELKSQEGINADYFYSQGMFRIGGLLNADRIRMDIYARCFADEIGGGEIRAGRSETWFGRFMSNVFGSFGIFEGYLEANIIEGDDIHLEHTHAKVVRGNNVVIGEGCRIGLVEYKNEFKQFNSLVVEQSKKM
jgi:cytoskeletal protein CcmA (bactofilin family)